MRNTVAKPLAVVVLLAVPPAPAEENTHSGRFEPWIAVTGSLTTPSGSLTTAYKPLLGGVAEPRSHAGQTLTLDAARGPGLEMGFSFFPSGPVGLQVLGAYDSSDLGGANGPYDLHLVYTSRQPPDYQPRDFVLDRSVDWPDTVGTLKRVSVGLGAVARFRRGRLGGEASAGVAYNRLSGEGESLAYTKSQLGGHSVLFSDEPHLAFALEGTGAIGFRLGAQADVALGQRAALVLGARYAGGGEMEVPVRLERVINADSVVFLDPVTDVQGALHPGPARISPRAFQVVLGLQLRP